MNETGGKGQIPAVLGVDRGDSQFVAFDAHGGGNTGHLDLTVKSRQAARQLAANPKPAANARQDQNGEQDGHDTKDSFTHGVEFTLAAC